MKTQLYNTTKAFREISR